MRWSQLVSLGESSENVRLSSFFISEEFSAILDSTYMSFEDVTSPGELGIEPWKSLFWMPDVSYVFLPFSDFELNLVSHS